MGLPALFAKRYSEDSLDSKATSTSNSLAQKSKCSVQYRVNRKAAANVSTNQTALPMIAGAVKQTVSEQIKTVCLLVLWVQP